MYESPLSSFCEANAFIPESFVFYFNNSSGPLAFPSSAPRLKIFNDSKYTSVNSVSQTYYHFSEICPKILVVQEML